MGRLGGTFIQHLTDAYPDWLLFRECDSTSACVDGAIYAIVGAAAVLAGVTQVSLSLCVVMIELTGGLSHLLPVVVAVLSANMVTNPLGSPSIYDSIVHVNRYPYLDVNIDLDIQKASEFELRAKDIMRTNLHVIKASGSRLVELEEILESLKFNGFPVVNNLVDKTLVGYLSRTELIRAVSKAREQSASPASIVSLVQDEITHDNQLIEIAEQGSPKVLNFSKYLDSFVPLVFEDTSVYQVYRLFCKLGIRYCCVQTDGKLRGVISKKDMIAYLDVSEEIVQNYFV
mmetsp:Transcript_3321/g.15704  ORF Transcript_3321/g.15704 Transcript_3321/m.15704 type:complete len:287 (-) Transcript_3321:1591-2451(-)